MEDFKKYYSNLSNDYYKNKYANKILTSSSQQNYKANTSSNAFSNLNKSLINQKRKTPSSSVDFKNLSVQKTRNKSPGFSTNEQKFNGKQTRSHTPDTDVYNYINRKYLQGGVFNNKLSSNNDVKYQHNTKQINNLITSNNNIKQITKKLNSRSKSPGMNNTSYLNTTKELKQISKNVSKSKENYNLTKYNNNPSVEKIKANNQTEKFVPKTYLTDDSNLFTFGNKNPYNLNNNEGLSFGLYTGSEFMKQNNNNYLFNNKVLFNNSYLGNLNKEIKEVKENKESTKFKNVSEKQIEINKNSLIRDYSYSNVKNEYVPNNSVNYLKQSNELNFSINMSKNIKLDISNDFSIQSKGNNSTDSYKNKMGLSFKNFEDVNQNQIFFESNKLDNLKFLIDKSYPEMTSINSKNYQTSDTMNKVTKDSSLVNNKEESIEDTYVLMVQVIQASKMKIKSQERDIEGKKLETVTLFDEEIDF